ncbi:MAG: hypothetical protein QF922_10085 [SAR324 cluster bacterium]|nr:hypothetical protein [SAR324 cluster bacterium]
MKKAGKGFVSTELGGAFVTPCILRIAERGIRNILRHPRNGLPLRGPGLMEPDAWS